MKRQVVGSPAGPVLSSVWKGEGLNDAFKACDALKRKGIPAIVLGGTYTKDQVFVEALYQVYVNKEDRNKAAEILRKAQIS